MVLSCFIFPHNSLGIYSFYRWKKWVSECWWTSSGDTTSKCCKQDWIWASLLKRLKDLLRPTQWVKNKMAITGCPVLSPTYVYSYNWNDLLFSCCSREHWWCVWQLLGKAEVDCSEPFGLLSLAFMLETASWSPDSSRRPPAYSPKARFSLV